MALPSRRTRSARPDLILKFLSWLQPFGQPPQRRGTTGDEADMALSSFGPSFAFPAEAATSFDDPSLASSSFCFCRIARSLRSSDQVRSLFSSVYLPLSSLRIMRNSQWFTLRRSSKYSTLKWYHFLRMTRDMRPCVTGFPPAAGGELC